MASNCSQSIVGSRPSCFVVECHLGFDPFCVTTSPSGVFVGIATDVGALTCMYLYGGYMPLRLTRGCGKAGCDSWVFFFIGFLFWQG
jgi:hypothetical protein